MKKKSRSLTIGAVKRTIRRLPLPPVIAELPLACLFLAVLGGCSSAPSAKQGKPNILLIFVDDLGYGELGCQGNRDIPTPHIDSLAAGGVRCTSGYVTASYCSPSRAGLLTGRYQTRFGYELNPVGRHNLDPLAGLPLFQRTLANQLKDADYVTGLVGKWHLGGVEKFHPLNRGFDEFFGFLHEGHYYTPPPYDGVTSFLRRKELPAGRVGRWMEGNTIWSSHMGYDEPPYDADNPILRGTKPTVEAAYLTDAFTREALTFLERHRSEPFFLFLSYSAVHSPMQGARRYMERFSHIQNIHRRVFAAMLSSLDDGVGAVLEKLRALGLEERTLVFFIGDNGGPTRELTSSNRPLRGGKGNLYEGGIRVPFIVQWKGTLPEGEVYPHPVLSTDVFATACATSDTALPEDRVMDGVNLLPFLTGQDDALPHPSLFWRMNQKAALRKGDWKIVRHRRKNEETNWELFDLSKDVGETEDLASERPVKLRELEDAWQALNAEMIEPVWKPRRR